MEEYWAVTVTAQFVERKVLFTTPNKVLSAVLGGPGGTSEDDYGIAVPQCCVHAGTVPLAHASQPRSWQ